MPVSLIARIVTWVVAVVAGVLYGAAGTIAHAFTIGGFPVGLILAIVGSGALLLAVRLLTADRWAALACGLGMMISALALSGTGPGGSVVVPDSPLGLVWTIALPLIVTLVVAWPSGIHVEREN